MSVSRVGWQARLATAAKRFVADETRRAPWSALANDRGNVAVITAILLPILLGGFGIGFETAGWRQTPASPAERHRLCRGGRHLVGRAQLVA